MNIIIFGAPGVGKGTQAKIISAKLDIPHISTGDILRSAVSNKTDLGLKAKAIMDRGDLVPDDLMGNIIREVLSDEQSRKGFILDGFPRTLNQAVILDGIFTELKIESPFLISIEAEDEVIVNRLSQRRICGVCNNIVNLIDLKDNSTCPICGAKDSFIIRKDDDPEVIKNRLKVFHSTTSPVIEHYTGMYKIIKIDGTQPVKEVSKNILDELGIN